MNQGVDVIDLGIGSPDLPPSDRIIGSNGGSRSYSFSLRLSHIRRKLAFREAVAKWYHYRFGVELMRKLKY